MVVNLPAHGRNAASTALAAISSASASASASCSSSICSSSTAHATSRKRTQNSSQNPKFNLNSRSRSSSEPSSSSSSLRPFSTANFSKRKQPPTTRDFSSSAISRASKDPYATLGVKKDAKPKEIKGAYYDVSLHFSFSS